MTKDEELRDAYTKLDAAEMQITRLRKDLNTQDKVLRLLIAAGFVTEEKASEARALLDGLPNDI
jgi:hypothetical protein